MTDTGFDILILRQSWIKDGGRYASKDLCSHGELYLKIGSEALSDQNSGRWSLTATGLFLLRSLDQDCDFGEFTNQMLACCGHAMYPTGVYDHPVTILECNSGVDWCTTHNGDKVFLQTETGAVGELSKSEHRRAVMKFVEQVERFYGCPGNKKVTADERDAYDLFWDEWHRRKAEAA